MSKYNLLSGGCCYWFIIPYGKLDASWQAATAGSASKRLVQLSLTYQCANNTAI
jgi:hypothetical protein